MSNFYIPKTKKELILWLGTYYPAARLATMPKAQLYAIFFKLRRGIENGDSTEWRCVGNKDHIKYNQTA